MIRGDTLPWVVLLHQLFAGNSDTKTLVVTPTKSLKLSVHERLSRELPELVEMPDGRAHPKARLCVVDPWHFHSGLSLVPEMRWGTIILWGRQTIRQTLVRRALRTMPRVRAYLIAAGEVVPESDQLQAERHVGPTIFCERPYQAMPPEVRWETFTVAEPARPKDRHPFRRKQLIWNDTRRNERIAEVAVAFDGADLRSVQRLDLALGDTPAEWEVYGGKLDVVVVVETPAHARALAQHLPGWNVLTKEPNNDGMSRRMATWQRDNQRRAIVTIGWIQDHGLAADVAIRADGTATRWQADWGAHPDPARKIRVFRLIDLQDSFDDIAERDSRQRLQHYAELQITG